ncbi:MAG: hypothetical protein JWN06_2352 [Propionibacteriaceae bacterium]|nr:hypothetical protein [Propionibacteriaceae bacterium]
MRRNSEEQQLEFPVGVVQGLRDTAGASLEKLSSLSHPML